ncbi:hypothetical protein ACLOJK_000579 [Asimina triloba]
MKEIAFQIKRKTETGIEKSGAGGGGRGDSRIEAEAAEAAAAAEAERGRSDWEEQEEENCAISTREVALGGRAKGPKSMKSPTIHNESRKIEEKKRKELERGMEGEMGNCCNADADADADAARFRFLFYLLAFGRLALGFDAEAERVRFSRALRSRGHASDSSTPFDVWAPKYFSDFQVLGILGGQASVLLGT